VTLADTDRLAYEVGDAMSFNVIIENTSAAPLATGHQRVNVAARWLPVHLK